MKIPTDLGSPAERATRMFFTRVMVSVAKITQDEALTVAQIGAVFLVDQQGSARVNELAEALGISASAASRMADGLVERDFFARAEDPDDRRARVLTLAPAGRAFVERLSVERMKLVRLVAGSLPGSFADRLGAAFSRVGRTLSVKKKSKEEDEP